MSSKDSHRVSVTQWLEWKRSSAPLIRVNTARDEVPGGLALAMAPLLVKWSESSRGFGPDDHYLVSDVNISSNPVGGSNVLATCRVPADGVESVEFVMVLSKVRGRETPAGHAMLRFIFKEDRRPVILSENGEPMGRDAYLDDLVVSWEAWRPPVAGFDPLTGLDPKTYALTARCFAGSVRCISDAILDRPWVCYPLQLPAVPDAEAELLYLTLLLADAVSRQTLGTMLEERIQEGKEFPDDYPAPENQEWEELKAEYERSETPPNPIEEILEGKVRYHLLERSCITMALTTVDWANRIFHERGGLGEPKRVRVTPGKLPDFFDDLAAGRRTSVLLKAPALLRWLMNNQTVIPGKAYELLDEVGLLKRENGELVRHHYDNRQQTPYGIVSEGLIY